MAVEPGRLKSTSSMSPGECRPGEFRTEQDLKVIKCYLSGRSLVCTSARPIRKHFDQEPGRMPTRGFRRVPVRNEHEYYKVPSVREASGLHFGPAAPEACRSGAKANANPESPNSNHNWKL